MIGRLFRGGFMTAVYAFLYIPILILVVNSFNSAKYGVTWSSFTTQWYKILLNNDSLLQAAGHSVVIAAFSATFATTSAGIGMSSRPLVMDRSEIEEVG